MSSPQTPIDRASAAEKAELVAMAHADRGADERFSWDWELMFMDKFAHEYFGYISLNGMPSGLFAENRKQRP